MSERNQDDMLQIDEFEYDPREDDYDPYDEIDDYLYNEDTDELDFDPEEMEYVRHEEDGRPDPYDD